MFRPSAKRLTVENAETIALQTLTYLLSDAQHAARFMTLTGLAPADLREVASSREIKVATLEYILSDEPLLLAFCQDAGLDPALVGPAHQLLSGTEY